MLSGNPCRSWKLFFPSGAKWPAQWSGCHQGHNLSSGLCSDNKGVQSWCTSSWRNHQNCDQKKPCPFLGYLEWGCQKPVGIFWIPTIGHSCCDKLQDPWRLQTNHETGWQRLLPLCFASSRSCWWLMMIVILQSEVMDFFSFEDFDDTDDVIPPMNYRTYPRNEELECM